MTHHDDDLTPAQEGKVPDGATLRRRGRAAAGRGRLLRPRSWLTLLVGAAALATLAGFLLRS